MNKEQIIAVLKFAIEANEKITKEFGIPEGATVEIMRNALSLINRQDEQIKKLTVEVRELQYSIMPN